MCDTDQSNLDDNNFLQDWLERRYGCGFAQMVIDDVKGHEPMLHAPYIAPKPYVANDNAAPHQDAKKAG